MTFASRLDSLRKPGESRDAFARRLDVPKASMRAYFEGSLPALDRAEAMARRLGVSLEWLATGEGDPQGRGPAGFAEEVPQFRFDAGPDLALVPRLDVQASAGAGVVAHGEHAVDFVGFQRAWLRSIGVNPDFASMLDVRGDSMEPTLRDGDIVIVDASIDRVVDNAIYVVVYDGLVLVKRVHLRLDRSVRLISDNDRYPAEDVPAARVHELNIAGRVMWFGRSM